MGTTRKREQIVVAAPWEQIAKFAEAFDGHARFGEDWGERINAARKR